MGWRYSIIGVLAVVLIPPWSLADDDPAAFGSDDPAAVGDDDPAAFGSDAPAAAEQTESVDEGSVFGSDDPFADDAPAAAAQTENGEDGSVFTEEWPDAVSESELLQYEPCGYRPEVAVRFGWWGVNNEGSPTRIGEYQSLDSSGFYDVDGIVSDGCRTYDFSATSTSNDSAQVDIDFYSPGLSVDFEYDSLLHRSEHDMLNGFDEVTDPSPDPRFQKTDNIAVDDDLAVRVQELRANFKGRVANNIRWRLNLWGRRKQGRRQVTALNHECGAQCHIQSEAQRIDWLIMEIQPVIEARFGAVTAEYSRTMRSFNQNDSAVSRTYGFGPGNFLNPLNQHAYAVVPENFTQIDRLKLGVDLTENTHFYANLLVGDTESKHIQMHRRFYGYDLRMTNTTVEGLQVTGFAKRYVEKNELPGIFPDEDEFAAGERPSDEARHPVDRQITKAGIKGRWKPLRRIYSSSGLALTGGYEYRSIDRQFTTFPIMGSGDLPDTPEFTFTQQTTISNMFFVGASERWSACFDTFVRYKMWSIDNPLLGVREHDEVSVNTALNTSLPTQRDLVEIGGTWSPTHNFLLSTTFGIDLSSHHSDAVNFEEDSFPITFTVWYAPTYKWSMSGGLGFFSNWIDQEITMGNDHNGRGQDVVMADYNGETTLVNIGSTYAFTDCFTVTGAAEWVRGSNTWLLPSPAGADWSALPGFSNVVVETTRLSAGIDYWLGEGVSCYFRYIYYDYDGKSSTEISNSGTSHMFLGGFTVVL